MENNSGTPHINPPSQNRVKIYYLLLGGEYPARIAKALGISPVAVHNHIRRMVKDQLIERIGSKPAFYRKLTPPSLVGHINHPPHTSAILLPHKYGATFYLVDKPLLKYNILAHLAIDKQPGYTIIYGKSKAVIWLHSFFGDSPDTILANAQAYVLEIAKRESVKHRLTLTLDRIFNGVEWVMNDKPASRATGLTHKPEIIAGAKYQLDLVSHPGYLEINQAPGYPAQIPTEHAKILYYLITQAPSDIKGSIEAIKEIAITLKEIRDSIMVLDQKIELRR